MAACDGLQNGLWSFPRVSEKILLFNVFFHYLFIYSEGISHQSWDKLCPVAESFCVFRGWTHRKQVEGFLFLTLFKRFMGFYGSLWNWGSKFLETPPIALFTCFRDEKFLPNHAFKGENQGWREAIMRLDSFEGISQCGLQHHNSSSVSAHPHQIWCLSASFCAVKPKWEAFKLFLLPRKEKYYPWWQNHQILLCANQCYIFQSFALKDII